MPVIVIVVAVLIFYVIVRMKGGSGPLPNQPPPTFRIVALGVAGSGKTVFLASLFHHLSAQGDRPYFLETDLSQRVALNSLFQQVTDASVPWPQGTLGTRNYAFDVSAFDNGQKYNILRIEYLDYDGRVFEVEQEAGSKALVEVESQIKGAHSLIAMLDGQRLVKSLQDPAAGREYLDHTVQPMLGVLSAATCPIQIVITKWDMVRGIGEPEGADDDARLAILRRTLIQRANILGRVSGKSQDARTVRLIPVSAVGPGFAQADPSGRVVKTGRTEVKPIHLDVPLAAVLPDVLEQFSSKLDPTTRRSLERERNRMAPLGNRDRLNRLVDFLKSPAGGGIAALVASSVGAATQVLPFLTLWMATPMGGSKAHWVPPPAAVADPKVAAIDRVREEVMRDFHFTVWELEKHFPSSILARA